MSKKGRRDSLRENSKNTSTDLNKFFKNAFSANIKTNSNKWGG